MPSLIPGFEYDIFISYRQKDNKYDGWVTEFVENLRRELGATFKEEVSVYFDINPHNGLLETHDVDASLREKLKCLVFIPIVSRTYCDPKSFAWQHEFKAFIEMAAEDQFGLRIRLPGGNVAPRVLPVRIHDLDTNDMNLCGSILGGVMRCIEFVYRSPGVNRPLRAGEDHPGDNLNKIYYRDQINKVANAAEEIISGMRGTTEISFSEKDFIIGQGEMGVVDYSKTEKRLPQIKFRFHPRIHDPWKRDGIFRFYSRYKKYIYTLLIVIPIIVLLFGWKDMTGLFGSGDSKREKAAIHALNAKEYCNRGELEAARREIALALELDRRNSSALTTLAAVSYKEGDPDNAVKYTLEALESDPENSTAAYNLAFAFEDNGDYHQAIEWYSKSIAIDSSRVPAYSAMGRLYNMLKQPADAILILKLAEKKYPESEFRYLVQKNLGNAYLAINQTDEAVKYLESSVSLNSEETETYLFLARAYETTGEITKSIDAWQKYIKYEPDTLKAEEARAHMKEITVNHLKEILK